MRTLFPVDPDSNNGSHLNEKDHAGAVHCGLHELSDMGAESKLAATRLKIDKTTAFDDAQTCS
jgi:hypothetical protein